MARLYGDFVIFSPSFDSEFMPLADEVGRATREATAAHLITQHPGTPWDQPIPTFSAEYYDQPYLGPSKTKSLSGKRLPFDRTWFCSCFPITFSIPLACPGDR